MRRSLAALAVAWVVLGAVPAPAQSFSYLGYKLYPSAQPYWFDDVNAYPGGGLPQSAQLQATQQSFQLWSNVSCSWAQFVYQGIVSGNSRITDPEDATDSFSVSPIWVSQTTDPYYNYALGGGTKVSAAVPLTYAGGLYACDIFLNAKDYSWSTTANTSNPPTADLQTFLMHEVGHCLGLGDNTANQAAVMDPSVPLGKQRIVLTAEDTTGELCPYYTPHTYGAPCSSVSPCDTATDPSLACISPDGGTGNRYCTKGCAPNPNTNSCGIPFVCQTSNLIPGSAGACLPAPSFQTTVGIPCTGNGQCGSGGGICLPENDQAQPSHAPLWAGGYCTQDCANDPCPTGSVCESYPNVGPICLETCVLGGSCRQGYACSPVAGAGAGKGVCVSACRADADCGSNQFCRTCDGVCILGNADGGGRGTAQIGDPCTSPAQCNLGQTCLKFSWDSVGVCAQDCSSGCSGCPQGSSCLPAGSNNQSYCLRACQVGTCQGGQMCGTVGSGQGCMPACTSDVNCSAGQRCSSGQCLPTTSDGGTCALCFVGGDGGGPPGGTPDSGIGPPSVGGCGCQGTGGPTAGFLTLLLVFTLAGVRRRCPPR